MLGLVYFHHSFQFPRTETPEWSAKVERWYQLDAAAFAVTETYWRHRTELQGRPNLMFLASPLASNLTDAQFVRTQAPSPAKFVHTLPNIRGASLLAVMEWAGEVYCVQKDPISVLTAISEGMQAVRGGDREVWIVGVTETVRSEGGTFGGNFTGHVFRLISDASACALKIIENDSQDMAFREAHDKDLFLWLKDVSGRFYACDFAVLDSRSERVIDP